ncbi:hypothetical protein PIB30_038093 [Stylosanthes scabra]|uniref:J domain-containing protein n=1 Tax=Stylosanthes scabra TaxID=79078 RepID=A0ABU6ZC75_9FABA|nr:hypothetical protein [Stylosanthes scabra]
MQTATRAEAERLLGIAEKLLQTRDLNGSREFAILAQETEPLLEGSDQILAIVDVLLAADNRPNTAAGHPHHHQPDWYGVLQVERRSNDLDLIKRHYRRLALLLHPDKCRFAYADHAFKLVVDAWAVLSDPIKKSNYDKELSFFSRVDLSVPGWVQQDKLPVRRTGPGPGPGPSARANNNSTTINFDGMNISMSNNTPASAARNEIATDENSNARLRQGQNRSGNFWTACPYCYRLYEYPRVYEGCCLRCQNCDRSFHGISIPSLPPLVPGQDAYYCCWGFFPMGFVVGNVGSAEKEPAPAPAPGPALAPVAVAAPQASSSLPNWMPAAAVPENGGNVAVPIATPTPARVAARGSVSNGIAGSGSGPKKRGRPRKYPLQS